MICKSWALSILLVALLVAGISGQGHSFVGPPSTRSGIHLTVTNLGGPDGLQLALVTSEGPMSRIQGAAKLYRHFQLGHALGLVAEPAGDGWLSVEMRVVKDGAEVSRASAVGRHVVGDVLNNQARVSAFP
jgi:hypothetical protein